MSQQASGEAFLAVVTKSGLVDPARLTQAVEEFRVGGGDVANGLAVADRLVEKGLLTRWQADKLLQGKHKGYFLGKYRLLSLLGRGGMSSVYLAEHVLMRRRCAIKVLPAKRVRDSSYLARFHREAQAVASFDHPNIVRAYDVDHQTDRDAEIHFLVMEYVEGTSLQDYVTKQGPAGFADAVDFVRQAALGLAHAHKAGMVHRDIKPGNLLRDKQGTVKILDLGLARFFTGNDEEQALTIQHDEKVLGTADYLAPEQAMDSHSVDARADIYALGCTLYFLLTGQPPFTEGTLAQRLMAHQTKEPPAIEAKRPDTPPSLIAIVKQLMAKKADDRYQTAAEAATVLLQWLDRHADADWRKAHSGIFAALGEHARRPVAVAAKVISPATTAAAPVMNPPVVAPAAVVTEPAVTPSASAAAIPVGPAPVVKSASAKPSAPVVKAAAPPAVSEPAPVIEEPSVEVAEPAADESLANFFAGMSSPNVSRSATKPAKAPPPAKPATAKAPSSVIKTPSPAAPAPTQQSPSVEVTAAVTSGNTPAAKASVAPPTTTKAPPPAQSPAAAKPTKPAAPVPDFGFLGGGETLVEAAETEAPVEPAAPWPVINLNPGPTPAAIPSEAEPADETEAVVELEPDVEPEPVALEWHEDESQTADASEVAAWSFAEETPELEVEPVAEQPTPAWPAAEGWPTEPIAATAEAPHFEGGFGIDTSAAPMVSRAAAKPPASKKAPAKTAIPKGENPTKNGSKRGLLLGGGGVALVLLAVGGWWFLTGGSADSPGKTTKKAKSKTNKAAEVATTESGDQPTTTQSAAATASSAAWTSKRETTVGAGGEFPTLGAALTQIQKNFKATSRNDRFLIKLAAGTYTERVSISGSDWKGDFGANIVFRGEGEVILKPATADPVFRFHNTGGVALQNLTIQADGKPVAMEFAESVERCLVQDVRITGYTDAGVSLSGAVAPSFTDDRLILERVRFQGAEGSVGIRATKGTQADSVDCQNIFVKQCRFVGPMAAGLRLKGAELRAWEVRETIFAHGTAGVEFLEGAGWANCEFVNNTFYQCPFGVRIEQQPPPVSKGILFRRNLFLGATQGEVIIQKGFNETTLIQSQMLSQGMEENWSDRAPTDPPLPGELPMWANSQRGRTGLEFQSTDPTAPKYLAPAAAAPQGSVVSQLPGEPSWIGAMGP